MNKLSWNKIQQGDEGAFRRLYDQYADLLYGYGMKIAGNDDLYIFEKRETCATPKSIPAYLCVSLRHIIISELKKENGGTFSSLDEVDTDEYKFDLEIDIETAIIRSELEREQLETLQKEINNLTRQQREVIYLKYYRKMSPEEIAQVMGLTSRTVYNTTHMAISKLRERLNKSFLIAVGANLWIFS